jgi:hypothetical protein
MDEPSRARPEGCRCHAGCPWPCSERAGIADACEECGCEPFTDDTILLPGQMEIGWQK